MFPNGKCIFLLRDPRDVRALLKNDRQPLPKLSDSIFASLVPICQISKKKFQK